MISRDRATSRVNLSGVSSRQEEYVVADGLLIVGEEADRRDGRSRVKRELVAVLHSCASFITSLLMCDILVMNFDENRLHLLLPLFLLRAHLVVISAQRHQRQLGFLLLVEARLLHRTGIVGESVIPHLHLSHRIVIHHALLN